MATIGSFTRNSNGSFAGNVKTLALQAHLKLEPMSRTSEHAPDYRVYSGNVELGAAWKKTAIESQRDYLSVTLDDPAFGAAIYARLVESAEPGVYDLIWNRPQRRDTRRRS